MSASEPPQLAGLTLKEFRFPFPRRELRILALADPAKAMARDGEDRQREVYWGEIWPAGVALADVLLKGELPAPDASAVVLDLGCGSGMAAVAAACAFQGRATILATDREPNALALTRMNAERNGVGSFVVTGAMDWSEPYDRSHPLILAADCIYHPDSVPLILGFLKRALARTPGARAVLSDPRRWASRDFHYHAQQAGFEVRGSRHIAPFTSVQGPIEWFPQSGPPTDSDQPLSDSGVEVTLYELRWP